MNATAATHLADDQDVSDFDPIFCETFEDLERELREVEQELGSRLNVQRNIRQVLIALDRAHKLEEDELGARWQELYSRYVAWAKFKAMEEEVCMVEGPPNPTEEDSEQKAAEQAAFAVFVDTHAYGAPPPTEANLGSLLPRLDHRAGAPWVWRVRTRTVQTAFRCSRTHRNLDPCLLHTRRSSRS